MLNLTEIERQRELLRQGICPYCERSGFVCVAGHIAAKHGVSRFELREEFGMKRGSSICAPDYSDDCRRRGKERSDSVRGILATGRAVRNTKGRMGAALETRLQCAEIMRAKAKEGKLDSGLLSEESKERNRIAARRRGACYRNRTECNGDQALRDIAIIEAATAQVKKANKRWRERIGPEAVAEHYRKLRALVPHEAQIKASQASIPATKALHADKARHARWLENVSMAAAASAKVPRCDWAAILERYQAGESSQAIAEEYGCRREYIRRVIRKQRQA